MKKAEEYRSPTCHPPIKNPDDPYENGGIRLESRWLPYQRVRKPH